VSKKKTLHVPDAPFRPGEKPDFSNLELPKAGDAKRPKVMVEPSEIRDLAFSLVRVLDDKHEAVGQWDPKLDASVLKEGLRHMCLLRIFDDRMLTSSFAPIGGGGLMSGTCVTTRSLLPEAKLFGAEPAGADDAYRSLKEGKIIPQTDPDTICDGLLTSLGEHTWNILKDHLEAIYTVTDDEVINAMRLVWERMKIIIEPSSATAVAVALKSEFKALEGLEKVGIILTGGNVELSKLPF